jgi:hypothetical protein
VSTTSNITLVTPGRRNRQRRGPTLLRIALACLVLGSAMITRFAISTADAATVPGHSSGISCIDYSSSCTMYAAAYGNKWPDNVYWYPRLQRWTGARWQTVTSPDTGVWHQDVAGTVFNSQANFSFTDAVTPGYWYRIVSFFYWSSTGYETPAEISSPSFASGIVLTP